MQHANYSQHCHGTLTNKVHNSKDTGVGTHSQSTCTAPKHFCGCGWATGPGICLIMVVSGTVLGSKAPPWHPLEGAQEHHLPWKMSRDQCPPHPQRVATCKCMKSVECFYMYDCQHGTLHLLGGLCGAATCAWVCSTSISQCITFLKGHNEGLLESTASAHHTLCVAQRVQSTS